MLLQEDARALDILRGVDAGALERCDDTVRLGLVLQVLHARLALQQLLGFIEVELARLDALEDAVLLGVLARVDPGRAGEAGGRCNGQKQRSKNNGLHHKSPLRCCRWCDDPMSALDQRTRTGCEMRADRNVRAVTKSRGTT